MNRRIHARINLNYSRDNWSIYAEVFHFMKSSSFPYFGLEVWSLGLKFEEMDSLND
ncbi:MAG TPA: hypothetical protein PLX15_01480 [Candidatus Woesearchaeota archaeon]|nr:hypothetical protein [Candidatus Woesearchaeota archaeon]